MSFKKKSLAITSLAVAASICGIAHASSNPVRAFSVDNYIERDASLRISIDMDKVKQFYNFEIDNISLCKTRHECYNASAASFSPTTKGDNSMQLVELLVEPDFVPKFIRFDTNKHKWSKKRPLINKLVPLRNSVSFQQGGVYELVLDLQRNKRGRYNGPRFKASLAAFERVTPTSDVAELIRKSKKTRINLDNQNISIVIPKHAVYKPGLVSVEAQRSSSGEGFVLINLPDDIHRAARVIFKFQDESMPPGGVEDFFNVTDDGEPLPLRYLRTNKKGEQLYSARITQSASIDVLRKDMMQMMEEGMSVNIARSSATIIQAPSLSEGFTEKTNNNLPAAQKTLSLQNFAAQTAISPTANACAQRIFDLQNNASTSLLGLAGLTGFLEINQCVNLDPNLHIVVQASSFSGSEVYYNFVNSGIDADNARILSNVRSHMDREPQSIGRWRAAINGFTWDALNIASGWYNPFSDGIPEGTQRSYGQDIAGIRQNEIEVQYGFTNPAVFGAAFPTFNEKPAVQNNISPFDYNIVSSRSAFLRNGQCFPTSQFDTLDRWSAITSVQYNGLTYFIMASTTSGTQTRPSEICEVFKAFGATDAIRLDGGGSAQLWVDGVLRNRLTGLELGVFGTSRQVLSAIGVNDP